MDRFDDAGCCRHADGKSATTLVTSRVEAGPLQLGSSPTSQLVAARGARPGITVVLPTQRGLFLEEQRRLIRLAEDRRRAPHECERPGKIPQREVRHAAAHVDHARGYRGNGCLPKLIQPSMLSLRLTFTVLSTGARLGRIIRGAPNKPWADRV